MKKIIQFILLFILSLSLSSCKNNYPELPFKEGDLLTDEIINEIKFKDKFIEYNNHITFVNNGCNIVIKYNKINNKIERMETYRIKRITNNDFYHLKNDMDYFEVSKKVGIPFKIQFLGSITVYYNTTDGNVFALGFGSDIFLDLRLGEIIELKNTR